MQFDPIGFIDKLVKGLILAIYDCLFFAFAGIALPFSRGTRRLWQKVVSSEKRVSTITYLALCILLTALISIGNAQDAARSALGMKSGVNLDIVSLIAFSLVATAIIDLLIRGLMWPSRNSTRRRLCESLGRITVAGIYLLVAAIVLLDRKYNFDIQPIFVNNIQTFFGPVTSPHPLLLLWSFPFAIVFAKALSIVDFKKRIAVGLLIIIALPYFLATLSVRLFLILGDAVYALAVDDQTAAVDKQTAVFQKYTTCRLSGDDVHVSTYLTLVGRPTLSLSSDDLNIYATVHYMVRPMRYRFSFTNSYQSDSTRRRSREARIGVPTLPRQVVVLERGASRRTEFRLKRAKDIYDAQLSNGDFNCTIATMDFAVGDIGGDLDGTKIEERDEEK
jgi:hypothetical protein